jgi:hypothetical protein
MSMLLEPVTESDSRSGSLTESASRVRADFAARRVKFRWFGTTKTLSSAQKSQAAESFGAQSQAISAAKRLIDTRNELYRNLTAIKSKITRYWKEASLAFPEPGIRLIPQNRIEEFDQAMQSFEAELSNAVVLFDQSFAELKEAARIRLGDLFDASDYPVSLADEFSVQWDFPNVTAPDYLRRLNPEVYRQQARLVSHLAERLAGTEDGKPKVFRDSTLTNLSDFFHRFRELNVNSNEQLDELVKSCEQLVSGVAPQSLRDNDSLRQSLSSNLESVRGSLDDLMVELPRRKILRRSNQTRSEP